METSPRARRRKPETSKTDLEPPIEVLRRTGCPPRGGIRRVCGEVSGCNRLGETPDEQVGQRWDQVEPALWGRSSIIPSFFLCSFNRLECMADWSPPLLSPSRSTRQRSGRKYARVMKYGCRAGK